MDHLEPVPVGTVTLLPLDVSEEGELGDCDVATLCIKLPNSEILKTQETHVIFINLTSQILCH